jgi:hypothetical protein
MRDVENAGLKKIDAWFVNNQFVTLTFVFQACVMEACLKKEIEAQQQVKTMELGLKELEPLYHDEINELSTRDLHYKISKIVEDTNAIKSCEKACFEFPQWQYDEEDDIANRFQKL